MPGQKRRREESENDEIHPARKQRIEDAGARASLAQIYEKLADDAEIVRLRAAADLLKTLSPDMPGHEDRVDAALTRLIKGLCSGRKAARLGFSVALSEVLRQAITSENDSSPPEVSVGAITDRILRLTKPDGKASGQEQRDYLLGQRFAFQALLLSGFTLQHSVVDHEWRRYLEGVMDLAGTKPWLRTECGLVLWEYLVSSDGRKMSEPRIKTMIEVIRLRSFLRTAEGVALWLAIADVWPTTLPKGVWHKKDPLCVKELPTLKKLLIGHSAENGEFNANSGARQVRPSFVWDAIMLSYFRRDTTKAFSRFWEDAFQDSFLAKGASAERKSLGLQIIATGVRLAPAEYLPIVLNKSVLQSIMQYRVEPARLLFGAAELPLKAVLIRAKTDPTLLSDLLRCMLEAEATDQRTRTRTVETLLQEASAEQLPGTISILVECIKSSLAGKAAKPSILRRTYTDLLLSLLRYHQRVGQSLVTASSADGSSFELSLWVERLLINLADLAYMQNTIITDAERSMLKTRLASAITVLLEHSTPAGGKALELVIEKLLVDRQSLHEPLGTEQAEVINLAKNFTPLAKLGDSQRATTQSQQLLVNLLIIQVYDNEPDAIEALKDLITSFQNSNASGEASTVLVEVILSLLSRQSTLLRRAAEHAFGAFAAVITADSLESLISILQQNENLSGQQELFADQDGDDGTAGSGGEDGDDEMIDVEDASDVEIVNGEVNGGAIQDSDNSEGDSESESDEGTSEVEENGAGDDDEEAAFDRKLAEVLETAGRDDDDSDDDGSDMDDEQMMALEPHLTKIFQERKKNVGKKQEHKDAKENIVNFKSRVLDLLAIYVKTQYANTLTMSLILPLTTLVRTTKSKPIAEKAFSVLKQYFEACTRHKSLPQPADGDACLGLLKGVHDEMREGGSKLHASACSRSSLFLARVLLGIEKSYYGQVADMYCTLQKEWYQDARSRVYGTVFTEWTSWSLSTRGQR